MSKGQIKRITKAEVERSREELEIRRAAGLLRSYARRLPDKVREELKLIAKELGEPVL